MCGIFGVVGVRKAAELTVIGLHGNQHRAIDYAGIVSSDGSQIYRKSGEGLVRRIFTKEVIDGLHGKDALGHIRYPTVADVRGENIQPILGAYNGEPIAIAHNGNLTNLEELEKLVPASKIVTSMDTEYILRLLEASRGKDLEESLVSVFSLLRGSFTLGILLPDRLIAVRDASGNRPLSVGTLNGGYCISSETSAFANIGAKHNFDVQAGTMCIFSRGRLRTRRFAEAQERKCRFEGIYYSHPASKVFEEEVGQFRLKVGRALEELFPVLGAHIVTPVPDSSNFIAMGYGESGRSGKYFPVIHRSHYVGRTFIAATQLQRNQDVAQKFAFSEGEIKGKNIVVVDDSIVRGTTSPAIVAKLRNLGAEQIHMRIGSPPIRFSCRYGINTPTQKELIASSLTPREIGEQIGVDSLEFLPLETLRGLSPFPEKFCFSCMDGDYW